MLFFYVYVLNNVIVIIFVFVCFVIVIINHFLYLFMFYYEAEHSHFVMLFKKKHIATKEYCIIEQCLEPSRYLLKLRSTNIQTLLL